MSASAPLLSANWFRVAGLRPRLAGRIAVQRISYRRSLWYVLSEAGARRSFRVNAAAYSLIGRCTGTPTLQALWEALLAEQRDAAPTQDELLELLADLHAAALLEFDRAPAFALRSAGGRAPAEPVRRNSLLSVRIPLGRPDAWLDRLGPLLRPLFSAPAFAAWAALVGFGVLAALLNLEMLIAHARLWAASPRLLLASFVAYPIVKALHELGHALALRRFGAAVPEWGLTLMMFAPVPYVDGSASAALASSRQRLVVSAAGIMVELALAAIALGLLLTLQPGWAREAAFAVFAIGAFSTLLVNGNPLLRFDGYHALTDLLQLPNLAPRSARWWREQLRARLLGAPAAEPLAPVAGERPWLWGYAPASLVYRVLASVALVAWLGHVSLPLGLAIGAYVLWSLVATPLRGLWTFLRGAALEELQRQRAGRRAATAGVAALLLFGLLPMPDASVAQGVVWLPDSALVRAGTDGFVDSIAVADGQRVAPGDVLFTLASPALVAERASLRARVEALEVERFGALGADAERAANLERDIDAARAALDLAERRHAQLVVRAEVAGRVAVPHAADLPGRYLKQGELLAQVLTGAPTLVRAAVPQDLAALVQAHTRSVSVRLAEADATAWPALLQPRAEGTVTRLPSAALGDKSGGPVATDPLDKDGLRPADGIVMADVQLAQAVDERVGGRAWVRFDHGFSPLALQAARGLQRLFLKQFNPSS